MKFVFIDPFEMKVEFIEAPDLSSTYGMVGLDFNSTYGVDHGMLMSHLAIVVNGDSLLVPPHTQRYFQIGHSLFGGKAIIYAVDETGETIDMPHKPMVVFFANPQEVERAIQGGQVERPEMRLNNEKLWEWKA